MGFLETEINALCVGRDGGEHGASLEIGKIMYK